MEKEAILDTFEEWDRKNQNIKQVINQICFNIDDKKLS